MKEDRPGRAGFRGNKQALPTKPCAVCQRPMTWRRRWAAHWDEVRYCSDACRARNSRVPTTSGTP